MEGIEPTALRMQRMAKSSTHNYPTTILVPMPKN